MASRLDYQAYSGQQEKVLLLWAKRWQPIACLSANVLREVCSYLHPRHLILGLLNQKITVFDIKEGSFCSSTLSRDIPESCVFSELALNSLIILGFNDKSVCSLSFPNLQFAPLPEMHADRSWPGIVRNGAFIFVFGGSHMSSPSLLSSSERYAINREKWETLPDLPHAAAGFSPVIHKERIFLPSDNWVQSLDVSTLTFATHCELPCQHIVTVAAAVGEEIVLLTWHQVRRVSLGSEVVAGEAHKLHGFSGVMVSRSSPLVVGRNMWFMLAMDLRAVRYSIDEQEIQTFRENA